LAQEEGVVWLFTQHRISLCVACSMGSARSIKPSAGVFLREKEAAAAAAATTLFLPWPCQVTKAGQWGKAIMEVFMYPSLYKGTGWSLKAFLEIVVRSLSKWRGELFQWFCPQNHCGSWCLSMSMSSEYSWYLRRHKLSLRFRELDFFQKVEFLNALVSSQAFSAYQAPSHLPRQTYLFRKKKKKNHSPD